MADYDLGTAHGRIKIDYDGRGASEAVSDFKDVDSEAESLIERFRRLTDALDNVRMSFGDMATRAARSFGVLAGGSAILLGLSRATGRLSGSLFKLRGGMGILSALSVGLGGIPDSMKGYPRIIKQIIKLSAAITLFATASKLLDKVGKRIARLIGQTEGFKRLSAAFPEFTDRIKKLGDAAPSISDVGERINKLGRPIHTIARLAFALNRLRRMIRLVVKVAAGIGGVALAFGALAGAIVIVGGLVDALEQLTGLIGFLPGVIAGAVAAVSSLKVGMQGFSEAMKNMDDLEKFNEAIKNLAPAAQETARTIRGLRDEWTKLRKAVQQKLFAGMAKVIDDLANTYFPILRQGMGSINEQFNLMAKSTAEWLQEAENVAAVGEGFGRVAAILRNLRAAIQPLLDAFRDLAIVGLRVMEDMSAGAESAAQNFADFVAEARRTGDLRTWMEQGVQGIKDLVAAIINLGSVFDTIFDAFDANNNGFLAGFRNMTESMDRFLKSAEGQQVLNNLATTMLALGRVVKDVLGTYLRELGPVFEALLPLIVSLAQAFGTTLTTAIKILAPALQIVADILGALAPILGPIAGVLLGVGIAAKSVTTSFRILKGIAGMLLSAVGTLLDILGFAKSALFAVGRGAMWAVTGLGRLAMAFGRAAIAAGKYVLQMARAAAARVAAGIGAAIGALGRLGAAFIALGVRAALASKRVVLAFASMTAAAFRSTVAMVASVAKQMARWTALAIRAMAKAAIIAAAWLIANPFVAIAAAVAAIVALIIMNWDRIWAYLKMVWNKIRVAALAIWGLIKNDVMRIWNIIKQSIQIAMANIKAVIKIGWAIVKNIFDTVWTQIKLIVQTAINLIKTIIQTVMGIIKGIINVVMGIITGDWSRAWKGIKQIFSSIINGIWGIVKTMFNYIWGTIKNVMGNIWDTIKSVWNTIIDWFGSVPGMIVSALGDLGSLLVDAGYSLLTGLWEGIKAAFGWVMDKIKGIASSIASGFKSMLGIGSPSRVFMEFGMNIMDGLAIGLESGQSKVIAQVRSVARTVESEMAIAARRMLEASKTGTFFEDFSFRGAGALNRKFNDQLADMFYGAGGNFDRDEIQKFLRRIIAGETRRYAGQGMTHDPRAVYRPRAAPAPTPERDDNRTPQALIGELNMPLQERVRTDELISKLMHELRRVDKGEGVYQR